MGVVLFCEFNFYRGYFSADLSLSHSYFLAMEMRE